jgi:hypothetical protein
MHDATDFWDGNWLVSPIELQAGGIRASVAAGLRAEELVEFRKQFEVMTESLAGSATIESMEGWLKLEVVLDGSGRLGISGEVRDEPGVGNTATFTIDDLDQTDLESVIRGLRAIEAAYPVLGSSG